MSTFKAKTNAAQISAKLLSTSALTTALLALAMNPARAQDATIPDVTVPDAPSIQTPAAPDAPAADPAPWTGFTDEEGSITVATPTTTFTDITQNTQLYVGTSANLDIPEGYHVNINQASSNYLFVAKAAPDADPTFILGRLTADGRVMIIDRNGVFTGEDSVIDVAGIVMTTGDINIEQLRANEFGQYEISNATGGRIDLNGTVTVADAGLAAFVAPSVTNSGVINATMGKVALASGETVTLDLYGDDLVEIAVPGNVADALVENTGAINANGGVVQISAAQAKDVVDNIINVSGIVDVSSVSTQGGKIVLSGGNAGKVKVTGILDASGATGGDIEVTGQFVSAEDSAVLDASGINGGGTVHFGGDWQGQGGTPTSEYAFVGQNAILNASSEEDGDGGEVVVWSDKATGFFGLITAKGGANSGNGGSVETSSKGYLEALGSVDASALNGNAGEWLLDPDNLTVAVNGGANNNVSVGGGNPNIITATGDNQNSIVSNATINNSLNTGTSVTLRTGDVDNDDGDITVNADITMNAAVGGGNDGNATLRMEAHDDIIINNAITASNGNLLNVELLAGLFDGAGTDGNNDVIVNANVSTNGGNFLAVADDDVRIHAAVATNGGSVTLTARGDNGDPAEVEISNSGSVNTTSGVAPEGDMTITAEDIILGTGAGNRITLQDGSTTPGEANLTILRSSDGTIGLGGAVGNMSISQAEIDKIFAQTLTVGAASANNNVTDINVSGLNTTTAIQQAVQLNATNTGAGADIDFAGTNSFNGLTATAADDITTAISSAINTTGDALSFTAGDDILLDGDITTEGNSATFVAGDLFEVDDNDDVIDTNHTVDGNVSITANRIDLADDDSAGQVIDAGTANVSIERKTIGNIMLGGVTGLGGMHLTQKEIGNIDAGSLTVGGLNTSSISVNGVNTTTGTITGLVTLITGANFTGNNDDVLFNGNNVFNGLTVDTDDSVVFAAGATVDSNGPVTFTSDTNTATVGYLAMSDNSWLKSNGSNVTVDTLQVVLGDNAFIDAEGGNIDVNNDGIFVTVDAGSLRTGGTGTISLHQWDDTPAMFGTLSSLSGLISGSVANAVSAFANSGSGQNTLEVHGATDTIAGTGAGDGVYTNETVVVSQANLKITGVPGQGPGGGNVVIQGTGPGSPVFNVQASNFNLDPVTVDAMGAAYGVIVNDAGANGLVIDGNTFRNSTQAGILVNADSAVGSGSITNNIFENTATRGVALNSLGANYTLNITNNTFGTAALRLVNAVRGIADLWGTVNITGANTAYTTGDGVVFEYWIDGGDVKIADATINSSGADGVRFGNNVQNGATVTITGSNITGVDDGIEFTGGVIDSSVDISNGNTITGTGNSGFSDAIDFRALISNSTVNINNNTLLQGADDGIQSIVGINGGTFNVQDNAQITGLNGDGIALLGLESGPGDTTPTVAIYNGAKVNILRNNIDGNLENDSDNGDGPNGDGVLISGDINGAETFVQVSANDIFGYNNGVHIFGDLNNAGVQVNVNSSITGSTNGVWFQGDLNNAYVTVNGNEQITAAEGVVFGGNVNGGFVQVSQNNDGIFAWNDGIAFYGNIGGAAVINIHDNIIRANQDGGFVGSGIVFYGDLANATVNIGDGSGLSDPSNFITVGTVGDGDTDGIRFGGTVGAGADINIDGNRIGYTGTPGNHGSASASAINGDGIEFAGEVNGNADIDITDNHILAGGNPSGTGDGVKFSGHVGGSANVLIGGSGDANFIDASGDGVEFNGVTGGTVSVISNTIVADENGVEFNAGSPSIEGGADVFVNNNNINAALDGVHVDDDITGAGTTFTARGNTIVAGDEGFDIDNVRSGAVVNIGGPADIDGNRITAGGNGIEFDAGIDATVLIQKNRISAGDDGINVRDDDSGHVTAIDTGAVVSILDNKIGSEGSDSIGGHGINVEENVTGNSTLTIARNDIGSTSNPVNLDGIHFGGAITGGSDVLIYNNNHGIHADDHGIYFGGPVNGGALVDIDDNIIGANEDNGVIGSGIFFNGAINDATINIGDGTGMFQSGASNIIRVANPDGTFGWDVSGLDGIHFDKEVGQGADINIDGNRLGYNANSVGGPLSNERLPGDGIEFRGPVTGNADIRITDNFIRADQDGIRFADIIRNFANIMIGGVNDRNVIDANDNGIEFEDAITDESLVTISYNEVDADNDGILFGGDINNADLPVGTSEQEIHIAHNDIYGGRNGIHFAGEVFGPYHDTLIEGNEIKGETGQGIVFDRDIDEAHVRIIRGNNIEGQIDGVRFLGEIEDGAIVNIDDNESIEGIDEEAIHFFDEIEDSTVTIVGNDNLRGGDHGIEFDGEIDGSSVTISGNNHGIHADNHGIVFFANVDDSTVNIHDNIISANEDGGSTGDGIHFAGKIIDSDVNIGDGSGPDFFDNPSNFIRGVDGIHFADDIEDGSNIRIDGNRIGYYKNSNGTYNFFTPVTDDGIEFAGDIEDDSTVKITENKINANDDGIGFRGKIRDWAEILIGGDYGQGNRIYAGGDGIQFNDEIKNWSLVEISHNEIEADENGIEFNGKTSNYRYGHDEEILIKKNEIVGGENGIVFYGKAEGEKHDIAIRNNYRIKGENDHGISHVGDIDDAELWITNNEDIYGHDDGIHIVGKFYNDARIKIADNSDIDSGWDDGIHVEDTLNDWGVDLDIVRNHVHYTGDDGIFVKNIENALIGWNDVHDTGGHGIYGSNIDHSDILGNHVWDTGEHGIFVNPTDHIDIAYNDIHDTGWDGIHVEDGIYAQIWKNDIRNTGDDGIHVEDNYGAEIWKNDIDTTGLDSSHGDGIYVKNSDHAWIKRNDVTDAGRDGINVENSDYVRIKYNDVRDAGSDGIDLSKSKYSYIVGNDVYYSGDNGIEVTNSKFITISRNDSHYNRGAGIFVDPSWFIDVSNNDLSHNTYGVRFEDVYFSKIEDNDIHENLIGIKLIDSHGIDVVGNDISENFWYGLWAYGGKNGYIKVHNNVFLDNPTHAFFQSGIIDLTGLDEGAPYSNQFIGGNVGLHFDAWHDKPWVLSLVKKEGGWTYDYLWPWMNAWNFYSNNSYTFDTFDGTTIFPPSNFGGTIGAQFFDIAPGEGQYFVKLGDKTFVVPGGIDEGEGGGEGEGELQIARFYGGYDGYDGYPEQSWKAIWLDARDSTYMMDGNPFSPTAQGGLVTPEQLAFLESMFRHWPDVNNRGIFWFGALPAVEGGPSVIKDPIYTPFSAGVSGLNVTITGLPNLSGGPVGPAGLNAIAPAAGDEEGAPADLADIEPAAGTENVGQSASCWGDAVTAAGIGGPVNYSYGGTFEESIAAVANCDSESF